MIQKILLLGDLLLREKSHNVKSFDEETQQIITDLRDTLGHFRKTHGLGRGIAAPQIGYLKKLFILK